MGALIVWTDAAGQHAIATELPLHIREPGHNKRRYMAEALDGSDFDVVVIGSGQKEARLAIVHEPAGDALEDLREAGLDGIDLSIYPEAAGQEFVVRMIEAGQVVREPETGYPGQLFHFEFIVRRLDGGELF